MFDCVRANNFWHFPYIEAAEYTEFVDCWWMNKTFARADFSIRTRKKRHYNSICVLSKKPFKPIHCCVFLVPIMQTSFFSLSLSRSITSCCRRGPFLFRIKFSTSYRPAFVCTVRLLCTVPRTLAISIPSKWKIRMEYCVFPFNKWLLGGIQYICMHVICPSPFVHCTEFAVTWRLPFGMITCAQHTIRRRYGTHKAKNTNRLRQYAHVCACVWAVKRTSKTWAVLKRDKQLNRLDRAR